MIVLRGSFGLKKIKEYYEKEALLLKNHQKEIYFRDPWNIYWHGTRLYQILQIVETVTFNSLLDVGCAEGHYLKLIASMNQGFRELYEVGLDIARNYLIKAKKEVHGDSWVLGDAQRLPFKDNSFDLVLFSEVLEHLPDPKRAFMEVARVSRKYILVSVASENLFYSFAKKLGLVRAEDPYATIGRGHIHEMKISNIIRRASETRYKCLKSMVTCYFPASFLRKHRAPSLLIPVIKLVDRLISRSPVLKEMGAVQIALLEKLRTCETN